jgi:hypothetical protein
MKYAWLGCLLFGSLLFGGTQDSDLNVNTRYTVDAVTIWGKGWKTDLAADHTDATQQTRKLSAKLRHDLIGLIGQHLNPAALETLAARIRTELGAREVTHRLQRGDTVDHVRVEFEVKPPHFSFDTTVTKFAYNSKSGWSGGGDAGFTVHDNSVAFGLVSDGDSYAERFAGMTARYENHHVGSDKVDFKMNFETYHEQWNSNTRDAAAVMQQVTGPTYRSRQNFQPEFSIAIAKPLTLTVGASVESFEEEAPFNPTESSNALIANLKYHRRFEGATPQDVEASYGLRSASGLLSSDFVYTSHTWTVHYQLVHGKHSISDLMLGGLIGGRAPLCDRYILGNSVLLRGWNKYDLDPAGGNRMIYNSVEYRYGPFQTFYDTGAIWDQGQTPVARHSLGIGIRESVFSLAVAFPVRGGHVEPVFMMGLLY